MLSRDADGFRVEYGLWAGDGGWCWPVDDEELSLVDREWDLECGDDGSDATDRRAVFAIAMETFSVDQK